MILSSLAFSTSDEDAPSSYLLLMMIAQRRNEKRRKMITQMMVITSEMVITELCHISNPCIDIDVVTRLMCCYEPCAELVTNIAESSV